MNWIGCVDDLSDTCISGWAADQSDLGRTVSVDIFVDSLLVATVPGAVFREDLRQAGIGDGCKGFQFDPGPYLKRGRNDVAVRYAGTDVPVARGQGRLVTGYRSQSPGLGHSFIAALQTYYQFSPEHHICEVGPHSGKLRGAILEAQLPFRKYTGLELQDELAGMRLPDKADLVVSAATDDESFAGFAAALRRLVEQSTNRPCYVAIDFPHTEDRAEQIRQAFQACGVRRVRFDSIASDQARRIFAFAEVGPAAVAGAEPPPVLAHIHVPKCAGTSFRVLLESYFGPRHQRLYVNDTYFVYTEDALRNRLLQDPEVRGFSSHHVRAFPRWLAGREMLYVTFLRDPIQQFVSYMTHTKKHYAGITSESLLSALPPEAPQLSLREFAGWLLSQDRDIPFRENHNVNFFARHSSPAASDRLEAAKTALAGFFFVGITERMDESVRKLQALAQAAGLDFPMGRISMENTSGDYRDDLSWIHAGDEVGSRLLRSVEKDRQLYDWAMSRLDAVYAAPDNESEPVVRAPAVTIPEAGSDARDSGGPKTGCCR